MNQLLLLTLLALITAAEGFSSFQFPIKLPWDVSAPARVEPKSPIAANDKVVVIGGTGGVGQLVTKKMLLKDKYQVCVVARDEEKAKELLLPEDGNDSRFSVAQLNLVGDSGASDEELRAVLQDATAIVISVGTTAFPTQRWKNGNNPKAIDCDAVSRVAALATASSDTLRRIVLLTSVGVERTDEMPFKILNLFGVLDAKRTGEDAVKNACRQANVSYTIIRPGRLVGGPYTNLDLAKLFQIEGGAENGVTLEFGDSLLGDCKRDACAEACIQALENEKCVDLEFSMVSNEEKALTSAQWGDAFDGMKQ